MNNLGLEEFLENFIQFRAYLRELPLIEKQEGTSESYETASHIYNVFCEYGLNDAF